LVSFAPTQQERDLLAECDAFYGKKLPPRHFPASDGRPAFTRRWGNDTQSTLYLLRTGYAVLQAYPDYQPGMLFMPEHPGKRRLPAYTDRTAVGLREDELAILEKINHRYRPKDDRPGAMLYLMSVAAAVLLKTGRVHMYQPAYVGEGSDATTEHARRQMAAFYEGLSRRVAQEDAHDAQARALQAEKEGKL
jgi:hypothetical protein